MRGGQLRPGLWQQAWWKGLRFQICFEGSADSLCWWIGHRFYVGGKKRLGDQAKQSELQ